MPPGMWSSIPRMTHPPTPHTPDGWDAASAGYDEKIAPMTGEYAEALIEILEVHDGVRVIEIAAGSGALTRKLAPRVASILATDFSGQMIGRLKAHLERGGTTNVECAVMNGMELDVEDGQFDRAVSNFGVMLFPEPGRGISELRRVLRPGGRAVVSGWAGPDHFEAFGTFLGAVRKALPDLPPPPGPPPIFSLADPAVFTAHMEAAGFDDVRIDLVERHLDAEGVDELWDMLTSGAPPAQALLERIGEGGAAKVRAALGEILSERFGDGPIRLRNVATVGSGVAPG